MKVLLFGRNPATVSRVTAALSAAGLAADGVASEQAALSRLGTVDPLVLGTAVIRGPTRVIEESTRVIDGSTRAFAGVSSL